MPFCRIKNKMNHSLQKLSRRRKVSLCTFLRGSLTVESAFVLPLFFLAIVALVSLLDLFRIQTIVTASLCQSAKELGMYAYVSDKYLDNSPIGKCTTAACILYGKTELMIKMRGENTKAIIGGAAGISLLASNYKDQTVYLRASYRYQIAAGFVKFPPIAIENMGKVRAWTGYQKGEQNDLQGDSEEMVYVTENGGVYHESSDCTYLDLSVRSVASSQVEYLRNDYGEKYHSCEKCFKESNEKGIYYITEKGNKYHNQKNCSGLKRTIRLVKKSEVKDWKMCTRCVDHGDK